MLRGCWRFRGLRDLEGGFEELMKEISEKITLQSKVPLSNFRKQATDITS